MQRHFPRWPYDRAFTPRSGFSHERVFTLQLKGHAPLQITQLEWSENYAAQSARGGFALDLALNL